MSDTPLAYEVIGTALELPADHRGVILRVETNQPADLALYLDRASLERLGDQIADALSMMPPGSDPA